LRLASEGQPVPRTGIDEFDAAAASLEQASKARRRSEERQDMLVGELNHRVKNTLAVVQSLAHQSFRTPSAPELAIAAFEARLQALAAAHNLLTQEGWKSAAMSDVVQLALAPFCSPLRCVVDGPPITLTPQAAVSLALAFHELATNASKYGALANDTGVIHVSWALTGDVFDLEWREEGGPLVKPPSRVGFGSRLIKRSLAIELGGKIDMDFRPQGLVCRVSGRAPASANRFSLEAAEAA
jgi:two-component sensor histidine kinase